MQVHTTLNRLPSASKFASPSPSPSSTPAILPENDPHPSWTFFHPSATYIPHAPYSPPSPLLSSASTTATSPRSSPTLSPNLHRQQQPSAPINNNNSNNNKNIPSSTPSTHHRILDHCFHVSIETRLKQAEAQYLASTQEQAVEQQIKEREELHQPPMSALKQDDWRRRQRTLVDEAVVLGRKGSNVEAIVDGKLHFHFLHFPFLYLCAWMEISVHEMCPFLSLSFSSLPLRLSLIHFQKRIISCFANIFPLFFFFFPSPHGFFFAAPLHPVFSVLLPKRSLFFSFLFFPFFHVLPYC